MPAFLTDLLNIFASLCKIRLYPQSLRIQAVLFYVDPCCLSAYARARKKELRNSQLLDFKSGPAWA